MRIIEYDNNFFPSILKNIKSCPQKLYVEGNVNILNDYGIAVIGSRDCSIYGEKWCEEFVKGLLEYNVVIISGMAKGIDRIAHQTALKYGGKTIAVLPSGFNNVYPKENMDLYKQIINSGGAIISEYEPNIIADSKKFLERNRIVSGLSIATLVVEAEHRSGTSVTARLTKEQGKKVFCIPGSLDNSKSIGTNKMIQEGAKLVTSVEDIVREYDFLEKVCSVCEAKVEEVDEQYKDVFALLSDVPIEFEELVKKSDLKVNELMSKLTMLELDGRIERLSGNRFIKKGFEKSKIITVNVRENVELNANIKSTQGKILNLIMNNQYITQKEIADNLGITVRTVERNINYLKERGKIERVGGKKNGFWNFNIKKQKEL